MFNGDETNFQFCPKTQKVLAPRGSQNVCEVIMGSDKEALTVIFTFSAAGFMCPPMIVYNYKRLSHEIAQSIPDEWGIGLNESGWINSEVFFYEFVGSIFHLFLFRNKIKLPVILFVNCHKSHMRFQLSQLCIELNIVLVALYP